MSTSPTTRTRDPSVLVLAYSGALASIAGFVNSIALFVWAFPVGNLTALTTKAGMHSTYPLLYQGRMIAAIVVAFFAGAATAGALLAALRTFVGPRHAAVLLGEATLLVAAAGIEHPIARAANAASACGLQNGMTSNFSGMPIRTTHFTGTITDLALLVGRSKRDGVDTWKATVLTTTVVLFVGGAAAGVLLGDQIGDHALIPPAVACVALAVAIMLHRRRTGHCHSSARSKAEPAQPNF